MNGQPVKLAMLTACANLFRRADLAPLTEEAAGWMGLEPGTAVAVANVDAHVSAPAATVTEPGRMVIIMGTSNCHMVLSSQEENVPGMCGVVEDGIIAGLPGLAIALPPGTEAQVRPRSGLALKHGVTVLNAPGTIDADYRGEVKIAIINLGSEPFTIRRGDRIAQLVVAPVVRAAIDVVSELDDTDRGSGGFGHTGV